jgi:hypothetical protein
MAKSLRSANGFGTINQPIGVDFPSCPSELLRPAMTPSRRLSSALGHATFRPRHACPDAGDVDLRGPVREHGYNDPTKGAA